MLKELVVALMEAPFLKQGFVNVMETLVFRIARHAASIQDRLHSRSGSIDD
jgi:hypothetical protein